MTASKKTLTELFDKYVPMAENRAILDAGRVLSMRVNKEERALEVDASFDRIIDKKALYALEDALKETYQLSFMKICPKYPPEWFSVEYFPQILTEARHTHAIVHGFLQKYDCEFNKEEQTIIIDIRFDDNGVSFTKDNRAEEKIAAIIEREFGLRYRITIRSGANLYDDSLIETPARYYAQTKAADPEEKEEEHFEKKATLSSSSLCHFTDENGVLHVGNILLKTDEPESILGDPFPIEPKPLRDVKESSANITVVGKAYSCEIKPLRGKGNSVIFYLTDDDASLTVKTIVDAKQLPAYQTIESALKDAEKKGYEVAYAVTGRYQYDDFASEYVLNPTAIQKIKLEERMDNAPEKRVELHLHTLMSTMDATINPAEIVALAKKWGHKAVAITDHGNVQGFQDAMLASEKLGMKVLYGMEAYFVDDTAKAIYGDEEITFDDEFVVFDVETTGLSALTCKLTEIGAVRVCKGKVLEVFNTFVNPEIHISEQITELTGITDEMVADAPKTGEAVRLFLDFIGDRTLVA
ncbi:MAG: PHP domain-containing protein, partial [Ruminococcus sp.]|nr:PHP domain-containing protein [Candidatus Apopatosoma intestinale]